VDVSPAQNIWEWVTTLAMDPMAIEELMVHLGGAFC
jgi:hypothetical protein